MLHTLPHYFQLLLEGVSIKKHHIVLFWVKHFTSHQVLLWTLIFTITVLRHVYILIVPLLYLNVRITLEEFTCNIHITPAEAISYPYINFYRLTYIYRYIILVKLYIEISFPDDMINWWVYIIDFHVNFLFPWYVKICSYCHCSKINLLENITIIYLHFQFIVCNTYLIQKIRISWLLYCWNINATGWQLLYLNVSSNYILSYYW